MARQGRTTSYLPAEDEHLCRVYIDISQDAIRGNDQSRDRFWKEIVQEYNATKPDTITKERNKRSLQSRMSNIIREIGKMRGKVRQVENRNPSGASEKDIMVEAKRMYIDDPTCDRVFKYDHVWPIMKDLEKFAAHDGDSSSNKEPETVASPDVSFNINLSDDNTDASTSISSASKSKRAPGTKTTKAKRAHDETIVACAKSLASKTTSMTEAVQKKTSAMERHTDLKTMMIAVSTISDPVRRAFFQAEQERILQKRYGVQYNQSVNNPGPSFNNPNAFGNPDQSANNPEGFGDLSKTLDHPEEVYLIIIRFKHGGYYFYYVCFVSLSYVM